LCDASSKQSLNKIHKKTFNSYCCMFWSNKVFRSEEKCFKNVYVDCINVAVRTCRLYEIIFTDFGYSWYLEDKVLEILLSNGSFSSRYPGFFRYFCHVATVNTVHDAYLATKSKTCHLISNFTYQCLISGELPP